MDAPTPPQKKLTKKEQKALAFRQGKKNAKRSLNEDDAVPEEEDLAAVEAAGGEKSSKKRKRDKDDKEGGKEAEKDGEGKEAAGEAAVDEEPKKKKRQRGKTPAQRAREAREKQQGVDGPAGADGAHRLLLFIGNLPYKVTVEEIQAHFAPCGETPTVRLLTPKVPKSSSSSSVTSTSLDPSHSKGCAFLEFTLPTALQSALRLHHSTLSSRKINVELTAGGGGNSEVRRKKIEAQRAKMEGEREKAAKNKRLKAGETEDGDKTGRWKLAAAKLAGGEEGAAWVEGVAAEGGEGGEKKKKVRDRRLKPGQEKEAKKREEREKEKAAKAMSGANAIKLASGWGNRA